tara:strand:- start:39463 stop:40143 length:681 start_codon:yes stop_codon:yes gene_type:complete
MLCIIVPYRATTQPERKDQLINLIYGLSLQLPDAYIYIIEQYDDQPFNRGALLNIGVKIAGLSKSDIICFHDVDLLPHPDIVHEYTIPLPENTVRHIGRAWKRYDTDMYLGGILMIRVSDFMRINGYPNDFWGWGGEDDELRDRINDHNMTIQRCKGTILDQENLTLSQKMIKLKQSKQKCPDKWERRAWHRKHPGAFGLAQVSERMINNGFAYGERCIHCKVVIQ